MAKLTPKAIIFDLGSTLIEYEAVSWDELNILCAESARQFLIERGHTLPEAKEFHQLFEEAKADYRRLASETLKEWDVVQAIGILLQRIALTGSNGFKEEVFDAYYQPVDRLIYVYPDTIDTLTQLQSKGYTIGLISNTVFPERAHRGELRRFAIDPFLKFGIFSSTFGVRKPHPDIFRHACELAGFAPHECLYVGDRYVEDVVGPTGIGMSAILKLKAGREYPSEMPLATRRIDTLSELAEHLEN
jgi:HAD superfamily hydrolase (TIGR01549 family)